MSSQRATIDGIIEVKKDEIEVLTLWYDAYIKFIRLIGTLAASIIVFTSTLLVKDLLLAEKAENVIKSISKHNLENILTSFYYFGYTVFCVCFCLLFTYNWYRTGIVNYMQSEFKNGKDEINFFDQNNLDSYKQGWHVEITGLLSYYFGGIAGISFIIGFLIYTYNMIVIIKALLEIP